MSQATRKSKPARSEGIKLPETVRVRLFEAGILSLGLLVLVLLLSLLSFDPTDVAWSFRSSTPKVDNWMGPFGAWFADVGLFLVGYAVWLLPLALAFITWVLFDNRHDLPSRSVWLTKAGGFVLLFFGATMLCARHFDDPASIAAYKSGGVLGHFLDAELTAHLASSGSTLVALALFIIGITLFSGLSWFRLMESLGRAVLSGVGALWSKMAKADEDYEDKRAAAVAREERDDLFRREQERLKERKPVKIEPVVEKIAVAPRVEKQQHKEKQQKLFEEPVEGETPSVNLLRDAGPNKKGISESALEAMSRLVELKLRDFGIDVQVVAVNPGPVITRFEMDLAPGIKASRVTNLAKDLARALAVQSVRVVEVIPGKSTVGLEVPNEQRESVSLREVIASREFDDSKSPLSMALGKDIAGQPVVVDLAKMPHLLVAGTTGSGKSVGLNAMLLSMLYKSTPEQLRLIMIDPKMLELSVYADIPHLLAPVVTDMKDAANALRWAVAEMDRRYKLMAAMGVRNLAGFNRKVEDAIKAGEPITDPLFKPDQNFDQTPPTLETLPAVVVVIDELADMMMIVGKKVEELIARIAQKARAAGIHLILATQRPSVDVITGLIKANVPTRIAFQVSSRIDSRTILDQQGAEQLLGQGDMLYLPPGTSVPTRVHGAYVADEEVHRVVDDWRKRGEPNYIDAITKGGVDSESLTGLDGVGDSGSGGSEDRDALYDEAVYFITEQRRVSVSLIQRKFKIGYNRAARLVEEMEAQGVVSSMASNGNREVLAPPPV
ncbi:DNA translocase FtsK [Permianibacter aggregans]|uniref:DNA translocase FtsK n=1 Tax=Permianibacter aggregans TaxID=1510150 RepID=A0A4R6USA9_9GAMM|nr:DNA translocase FtsK [Permianibacter aggregans]QGX38345.1 DNA translocase FtsK [Permianibacter aggregans]TDQ48669.1 DNA translocase FtsK [Permianibacter aggregans]